MCRHPSSVSALLAGTPRIGARGCAPACVSHRGAAQSRHRRPQPPQRADPGVGSADVHRGRRAAAYRRVEACGYRNRLRRSRRCRAGRQLEAVLARDPDSHPGAGAGRAECAQWLEALATLPSLRAVRNARTAGTDRSAPQPPGTGGHRCHRSAVRAAGTWLTDRPRPISQARASTGWCGKPVGARSPRHPGQRHLADGNVRLARADLHLAQHDRCGSSARPARAISASHSLLQRGNLLFDSGGALVRVGDILLLAADARRRCASRSPRGPCCWRSTAAGRGRRRVWWRRSTPRSAASAARAARAHAPTRACARSQALLQRRELRRVAGAQLLDAAHRAARAAPRQPRAEIALAFRRSRDQLQRIANQQFGARGFIEMRSEASCSRRRSCRRAWPRRAAQRS